jgi:hypothetical protein
LKNYADSTQDIEFASIMVQNLNNNLITAPELADLRKRLRNLETKVLLTRAFFCTPLQKLTPSAGWSNVFHGPV